MARLIVLADDWGRHPSSCQHLVRHLCARHPTLWVNTIGTRRPRLSRSDAGKIARRAGWWLAAMAGRGVHRPLAGLTVIAPPMWPRFRRRWQRELNAMLIGRAIDRRLAGEATTGEPRIVLATVPTAAALLGRVSADAWIYYRVDDFAAWPGLDSDALRELEAALLAGVDRIVAASATLQAGAVAAGRRASLLTHGVDVAQWDDAGGVRAIPAAVRRLTRALPRPIAVFWGLIDRRLDVDWLRSLTDPQSGVVGSLVLAGPIQDADPEIAYLPGVRLPGPMPYEELPGLAAAADVLVMPYADLPATRAMQPLKLKEYLATGKPVVVRDLPATREWADAADVVDSRETFAHVAAQRARDGVPEAQRRARRRLLAESWEIKARALESIVLELADEHAAGRQDGASRRAEWR